MHTDPRALSMPSLPSPFTPSCLALRAAAVLLVCAATLGLATSAPAMAATAPLYRPGVVVVGLSSSGGPSAQAATLARAGFVHTTAPVGDVREVRVRSGESVMAAAARLRHSAGVAWAVPDYIAHAAALPALMPAPFSSDLVRSDAFVPPAPLIPNDRGRAGVPGGWQELQWNFDGTYGVNAPQAWANVAAAGRPGGRGVTVAVLDTGIAYAAHGRFVRSPDFSAGQFVRGYDFVGHQPYPEDRNGHGTFVAGTIAEATNNHIALTGLAYGVKLMPIRVLDSQGNGDALAIAEGIIFAVRNHAQIINLSLEFTAGTVTAASIPQLIAAINYARSRNVLIVAAAGNEGADQLSYPARARGVLAVGATTIDGCLGFYSNYGSGLGLVAPGGNADASIPTDPRCSPNGPAGPDIYQETYASLTAPNVHRFGLPTGYFGTSMAAPEVTATAALVIASGVLGPHPTVAEIVSHLEATARPLTVTGRDYYGAGLLDAAAATAPATGSTGPTGTTGTTGAT